MSNEKADRDFIGCSAGLLGVAAAVSAVGVCGMYGGAWAALIAVGCGPFVILLVAEVAYRIGLKTL